MVKYVIMNGGFLEITATLCFALAILHTFLVKRFRHIAHTRFKEGSVGENFFHLLGEVEIVFGFWAALYVIVIAAHQGKDASVAYLQDRNFTEPAFVFVIMSVCSTKPVLELVNRIIDLASRLIPLQRPLAFYFSALVLGPLLGSFITEPAAMTVTALILLDRYYRSGISPKLKYATIGLLFVNVSVGGTLTPYAAPPVLMVAPRWDWDLTFMLSNFGWKAALACVLSTAIVTFRFRREIAGIRSGPAANPSPLKIPSWVMLSHLGFLFLIVASSHYMVLFFGLFLFFLGLVTVTREYQSDVKLKDGLLVAFFLSGLVVLGAPQKWWLEPVLGQLSAFSLFLGTIPLTAIMDNAAITYLGSQVPSLSELSKYALVAGSVAGGGLTVIANAPNPAGYTILNSAFGEDGIAPLSLFLNALFPTVIAVLCFWVL